ncbi:unnamed protein product [Brassica rapa subsp. narinosa]
MPPIPCNSLNTKTYHYYTFHFLVFPSLDLYLLLLFAAFEVCISLYLRLSPAVTLS